MTPEEATRVAADPTSHSRSVLALALEVQRQEIARLRSELAARESAALEQARTAWLDSPAEKEAKA